MPNCQWFATKADHVALLTEIFERGGIELYELYSRDNVKVRRFESPASVMALYGEPFADGTLPNRLHLNIRVLSGSPKMEVERLTRTNGSWKERTGSLGFVQLYLACETGASLDYSTTNTVTAARLGAVEGLFTDTTGLVWDVGATNKYSSWLNRRIRRLGTAKLHRFPVLQGALPLWDSGVSFWNYNKADWPDAMVRP